MVNESRNALYQDISDTAEKFGMKILSDDFCCKLLAWVLAYGGANEAVIFNTVLNIDINTAQKRLNIIGGEIPNIQLLPIFQKYSQELKGYLGMDKNYREPDWVEEEINKKYKLKSPGNTVKTKK